MTPLASLSEEALLAMARAGSGDAFGELWTRCSESCMRVALAVLRHRENAEDAVQCAAMKAYTRLGQFQGGSRFSSWAIRIVLNDCFTMRRSWHHRAMTPFARSVVQGASNPPGGCTPQTPEQMLLKDEVISQVRNKIRRAPGVLREVLVLRLEGLNSTQIGTALCINTQAAKSRITRAQHWLADTMKAWHLPQAGTYSNGIEERITPANGTSPREVPRLVVRVIIGAMADAGENAAPEQTTKPTVIVNVVFHRGLVDRLDAFAQQRGVSRSHAFRELITEGLDRHQRGVDWIIDYSPAPQDETQAKAGDLVPAYHPLPTLAELPVCLL